MSEMVERLARALWTGRMHTNADTGSWEVLNDVFRDEHRNEVRAILRAIREPTSGQLAAFARACDGNGFCLVKTGWKAMIDAAIDG